MSIRLLAIDLDGTLVNHELEMNPRDVAAVKAAAAAGVAVVLATGRMFKSSLRYAEPLGLTGPIINYQGAVVREIGSGEVWYRCELTVPMQQRVLALAEPRDWHVNAYVDERVYTARARPEADLYARVAMVPYEVVGPLSKWVRQDSTKIVLVDLDPENVPARMAELSAWMGDVARVTRSLDWFVEVVNPQVSKAQALALVADRLGIGQAEVCAIGDNMNDEDMVSWAGFGVAMRNAPAALKTVAKYVTASIDEAGVAQVIERFVIGKEEPLIRA
ncbi:MAG TPA: Cof-type HAD-IIB family hydrolase [Candidatus Dormibacteraeota bacterium]|nr:Cof-type HAD-IIB family hydrolase [Candidatus Dormibacteraeota bacterium]